jgi:hypothetical protein
MKTKMISNILGISLVLALGLLSCEDDEQQFVVKNDTENTIFLDEELSHAVFENIFSEVEYNIEQLDALNYNPASLKSDSKSAICDPFITVDIPNEAERWPKTITIDYGDSECTGPKGHLKKGKIIVVLTGLPRISGSQKIVTFEDFYLDGNKVEGEKTITFVEKNDLGFPVINTSITGGKITTPDGLIIERESNRQREWISGFRTPYNRQDNEFLLTGWSSGSNSEGNSFSREIIEPLNVFSGCHWIRSGVVKVVRNGENECMLDYGNGECDNKALLIKDGEEKEIILRRKAGE